MRRGVTVLAVVALLVLGLVAALPAGAVGEKASGNLVDGAGNAIGTVQLEETANGVTVRVNTRGIDVVKPGMHGIHFHAVGKCEGPAFTSAGGHFNPLTKKHGFKNPDGPHTGDLPNLPIDSSTATQGSGYVFTTTTRAITLSAGPNSIFDADGTAFVIHASPDDEVTDPAGNSGDRIACAVLTAQAAMPNLPNTGSGGAVLAQTGIYWPQATLLTALFLLLSAAVVMTMVRRRRM